MVEIPPENNPLCLTMAVSVHVLQVGRVRVGVCDSECTGLHVVQHGCEEETEGGAECVFCV